MRRARLVLVRVADLRWRRWARLAGACLALVLAGLALGGYWRTIPPGDNPFMALALNHPMGAFTRQKLIDLERRPALCHAALENGPLEYRVLPPSSEGEFCRLENALVMEASQVDYSYDVRASCPLAAALYVWEREVLQPLAQAHLGSGVRRVEHVGTYACRRVYGGRRGEPSQHATANAIDVIGFTLEDGRVVSVLKHWDDEDGGGEFLRALHAQSCQLFRGVLGPEYNRFHRDHLHLDMGPYDLCE